MTRINVKNKIQSVLDLLKMEGHRPAVSVSFKNRIVGQSSEHCIPSSFVLRKLELNNFQQLLNTPHLANIEGYLVRIRRDLEEHDMFEYLAEKQLDILQDSISIFLAFRDDVIPQMKALPFYLGVDRTYKQEISQNSEVTIDNFKEFCLKWTHFTQTGKTFLKIYKDEDLVIIGQSKQDHKQFKGIKLYTSQTLRRVEIGRWKQTTPIKILQLTYRKSDSHVEIYYREFIGRKLLYGQIREITSDTSISIYRESNQPNP